MENWNTYNENRNGGVNNENRKDAENYKAEETKVFIKKTGNGTWEIKNEKGQKATTHDAGLIDDIEDVDNGEHPSYYDDPIKVANDFIESRR